MKSSEKNFMIMDSSSQKKQFEQKSINYSVNKDLRMSMEAEEALKLEQSPN